MIIHIKLHSNFNTAAKLGCMLLVLATVTSTILGATLTQNVDAKRLFTLREAQGATTQNSTSDSAKSTGNSEDSQDNLDIGSIPRKLDRITTRSAALDPQLCVQYDKAAKEITVACKSTDLSHVYDVVKNPNVLKKENDSVWLLNANLTIDDGATFHIGPNDTKWLKINSSTSKDAYHIEVLGNLDIDSVKISSWNTTSNNFTSTDGKIHRASIAILPDATGKTNISNSELSHLGYGVSLRQGISYYGGDGSRLWNNTIHDLWYGFYSRGVGHMTLEGNHFYSNVKYGLDPHTGTHDMDIKNNDVHDTEGIGIVCSFDCKNIVMEGNNVHNNALAGIMLSRNVTHSAVRNNTLHNEAKAIVISESHGDKIYNNTITDSDIGIEAKFGSSNNEIQNNTVLRAAKYGIQLVKGANENLVIQNSVMEPARYGICVYNNGTRNSIVENKIINSEKHGICLYDKSSNNEINSNVVNGAVGYGIYVTDFDVKNNTFSGNQIHKAKVGISISNNTDSQFSQNDVGLVDDSEYLISGNSGLKLKNTTFSSDRIKATDGDQNVINIVDSGIVDIKINNGNKTSVDTDKSPYSATLPDGASAIVGASGGG